VGFLVGSPAFKAVSPLPARQSQTEIQQAADDARDEAIRKRRLQGGRASTIATGPLGITDAIDPSNLRKTALLGGDV